MASMHAPAGRAIRWMLVIVIAVTLGCRGSRPFSRYVQVTKTSDPDLPSIEAPAQRLATAKPRNGEDATSPHQSARSPSTAAVNAETALDRGPNASEAVAIEAASSNVPQDRTATSRTSTPATAVSTRLTSNSSPTVGAEIERPATCLSQRRGSIGWKPFSTKCFINRSIDRLHREEPSPRSAADGEDRG